MYDHAISRIITVEEFECANFDLEKVLQAKNLQRILSQRARTPSSMTSPTWTAPSSPPLSIRRMMRRIVLRMSQRNISQALDRWMEKMVKRKAMVAKCTRAVLRWKLRAVVRCLEAWRGLTAQEVQRRGLMGRIVARMLYRSLSYRCAHALQEPIGRIVARMLYRSLSWHGMRAGSAKPIRGDDEGIATQPRRRDEEGIALGLEFRITRSAQRSERAVHDS